MTMDIPPIETANYILLSFYPSLFLDHKPILPYLVIPVQVSIHLKMG